VVEAELHPSETAAGMGFTAWLRPVGEGVHTLPRATVDGHPYVIKTDD